MERVVNTKFYQFDQNNSGGYFDVDENVCHRVVIEAINSEHALSIIKPMLEDQSPSCSCCGDRWNEYLDSKDEVNLEEIKESYKEESFKTLEDYYQYLANNHGWTSPDVRIHYLDGTKKEIFKVPRD